MNNFCDNIYEIYLNCHKILDLLDRDIIFTTLSPSLSNPLKRDLVYENWRHHLRRISYCSQMTYECYTVHTTIRRTSYNLKFTYTYFD